MFNRRQFYTLFSINKANPFSMMCNGRITTFTQFSNASSFRPILFKCKIATVSTTSNQQQFRSFWLCCPLQNASDDGSSDYINLDHLWAAKPAATMEMEQNERNEPKSGDWWTKNGEEQQSGTVGNYLAQKSIRYGEEKPKWLNIHYKMGRSGRKFICFNKNVSQIGIHNFPKIHVPEDVFAFVRAMDEVLNAVNRNRDKIEDQTKTNPKELVLYTAKAEGLRYDFELDLCLRQSLFVQMRTVPNESRPEHIARFMRVPIEIFHWMRHAIGEVFVESGEPEVQQQLGKPPRLPEWLRR